MSEQLSHHPERQPSLQPEVSKRPEVAERPEFKENQALKEQQIGQFEAEAKRHAVGSLELPGSETEGLNNVSFSGFKAMRRQAYQNTLRRVQARLPVVERTFSRLVHQPTVDRISNATGTTLARPSGVLGAGIVAFIGNLLLIYLSRHYGIEYSYFSFFVLVGLGFLLGLGFEAIIKLRRKSRSN